MEKEIKSIIATQIRLADDLYRYINSEAERLGLSLNATMNSLIDDGRRFREATIIVQMKS